MSDLFCAKVISINPTGTPQQAGVLRKKSNPLGKISTRHFLVTVQIDGQTKQEVIDITDNIRIMGSTHAPGFWDSLKEVAPEELNVRWSGPRLVVYVHDLQYWMHQAQKANKTKNKLKLPQ